MDLVPVNGNVQSPKSTMGTAAATLEARLSECSGGGGGGGGPCTPAGPGALGENEPMGTDDFKELYFSADRRRRIESCLREKGAF